MKTTKNTIEPELMKVLACPRDYSELSLSKDGSFLKCRKCRRKYGVREGIPIFV